MLRAIGRVGLILAALMAPLAAAPAWAQTQVGDYLLQGDIVAGFRFLPSEPSKSEHAKFEEYRDVSESLFLDYLALRLSTNDEKTFVELGGRAWGLKDQEYLLGVGRLGLWEGGFEWNQIPHVFSTNARFLAVEPRQGLFLLPTPRPPLNNHNFAPEPDEIALRRDDARIFFKLTPTPWIDITAEYTRIRKDGERPFGMTFGSPGNNFYEILEPIDQVTHDFRVKAVFAREAWQIQLYYGLSAFRNSLTAVAADNPCFGVAVVCSAGDAGGPSRGQISLTPDNTANTVAVAGGVNVPWWRTRITGAASYSLRLQDQSFLPQTINQALIAATNPALLALPANSLDGTVGITTVNLNATSRPLPPLTLTFKYRLFDFNDMTDELIFPANVVSDKTVTAEPQRATRFDQRRQNVDTEGRWRFGPMAAAGLGGGWEGIHRSSDREVQHSNEAFARAVLDVTPAEWLLARLTYRPSFRRVGDYNSAAQFSRTVVEDVNPAQAPQSPLLRKFDEADRNRQRVDLLVETTPIETFTASFNGGLRNDEYYNSTLGLQVATAWTAGVDLTWSPSEQISLSGGYNYEYNLQRLRSRYRPSLTEDFPDFDWISTTTDRINSFYVGLRGAVIPRVLDVAFGARYEYALSTVANRNPSPPTSGTAAQQASATALHFPATEDSMFRLDTAIRYHFQKHWTASLGYAFEVFHKTNWQTDQLNPFLPGVSSIWQGNDLKDYTAHIVGLTLGYKF